jgi:hypothetical protein
MHGIRWGCGAMALLGCGLWSALAGAEEPAASTADLDGAWLTLGPVVGAARVEDEWTSAAGGELSVVWVRERCVPAALGVTAGGRLGVARAGAFGEPLPFAVGLGLGVAAEVDAVRPPRLGVQGTLWFFLGVIPYLRGGAVAESGVFVEAGLMIKLPVRRL